MRTFVKRLNPLRYLKRVRVATADLRYLRQTFAPRAVIRSYLKRVLTQPAHLPSYETRREQFKSATSAQQFSNDWFTGNIPHWLAMIDSCGLRKKSPLRALEIGSWEGMSSCFLLSELPQVHLTCVDTWEGADEHKALDYATQDVLSRIAVAFDANTAQFRDRLTKFKGLSYSYFQHHQEPSKFDFIYVDGSHYCDDVLIDALKSFSLLNEGGVMVFDDYLWKYYPREIDNPAAAINTFLQLKVGQYRVVSVYYQLIIQKLNSEPTGQHEH